MPEKTRILGMSGLARNTDLGKIFSQKRFWGPLLSDLGTDLGTLHVYRFDISQGSRFARKQGGSHEKERLQRAL